MKDQTQRIHHVYYQIFAFARAFLEKNPLQENQNYSKYLRRGYRQLQSLIDPEEATIDYIEGICKEIIAGSLEFLYTEVASDGMKLHELANEALALIVSERDLTHNETGRHVEEYIEFDIGEPRNQSPKELYFMNAKIAYKHLFAQIQNSEQIGGLVALSETNEAFAYSSGNKIRYYMPEALHFVKVADSDSLVHHIFAGNISVESLVVDKYYEH